MRSLHRLRALSLAISALPVNTSQVLDFVK